MSRISLTELFCSNTYRYLAVNYFRNSVRISLLKPGYFILIYVRSAVSWYSICFTAVPAYRQKQPLEVFLKKKVFLKISQNSQESTCSRVLFQIKMQVSACDFIKKETLALTFSCEFWQIFKNTFLYRTTPVAASVQRDIYVVIWETISLEKKLLN